MKDGYRIIFNKMITDDDPDVLELGKKVLIQKHGKVPAHN